MMIKDKIIDKVIQDTKSSKLTWKEAAYTTVLGFTNTTNIAIKAYISDNTNHVFLLTFDENSIIGLKSLFYRPNRQQQSEFSDYDTEFQVKLDLLWELAKESSQNLEAIFKSYLEF